MAKTAYTTLSGAKLTTDPSSVIDFNTSVETIAWQIVPAGSITLGAVTLQISMDGATWFSPPTAYLSSVSSVTAANPLTLTTGGQAFLTATHFVARYARAIVSTNITGTGASVTVMCSGV